MGHVKSGGKVGRSAKAVVAVFVVIIAMVGPPTRGDDDVLPKNRLDWYAAHVNFSAFYPDKARSEGVQGTSVIDCVVSADGHLKDCLVTSEEPDGYGFGRAEIQASKYFRLKAVTLDGIPTAGRHVQMPLHWTLS